VPDDERTTNAQLTRQSDQFLDSVREIRNLENQKRAAARSSPEFHALAEEITEKSRALFHQAARQQAAGEEDSPDSREREEQYPGDWTRNAEH
jgi:hypothetical protein